VYVRDRDEEKPALPPDIGDTTITPSGGEVEMFSLARLFALWDVPQRKKQGKRL